MGIGGQRRVAGNNRGVALFLTLALVAVLTAAALAVKKRSVTAVEGAVVAADLLAARESARSGIALAMALLADDAARNEIDSVQEDWADGEKCAAAVALLGFPPGSLALSITDELGKIQVNALLAAFPGNTFNEDQKQLWERLLERLIAADKSLDDRDPAGIINAIKDWLDSGDDQAVTGISGAEAAYYEALDPPVHCADGPIDTLDELFLIKGISRDFLRVRSVFSALSTTADGEVGREMPALSDLFSVYGMSDSTGEANRFSYAGTININTANEMVLSAMLPTGMEDQAAELVAFRMEKTESGEQFVNALDKGWYKQVIQMSDNEEKAFERIVSYASTVFSATAVGTVNSHCVTLTGIIKREKDKKSGAWTCRLLGLFGE